MEFVKVLIDFAGELPSERLQFAGKQAQRIEDYYTKPASITRKFLKCLQGACLILSKLYTRSG